MLKHAHRLTAGAGIVLATLTLTATAASAKGLTDAAAGKPLKTAAAIVRATDRSSVIETRDGKKVAGHAVYASYSDRRSRIAATYLEGRLVQGTVDTTLYAANGSCFKHEQLSEFVGLSQLATSLLPLPTHTQRVSYTLTGRALHWREPATKQHGVEHGTVEFNARDQVTGSYTATYSSGHSKVDGQTISVSYPAKLPRSVPAALPKPVCEATAGRGGK
jgi:hypothetical protein